MLGRRLSMAKLIFIGEKFNGRVYEFAGEKTTVGRGDHNTLTIHDSSVSHSHAEVLVYGTEVIVRDLGSSNGTYVNGVRLQAQQRSLLAGQIVEFGSVLALLELESPSASDTATDITAMHSYVRHLRDEPEASKKPASASMTLDAGMPSATTDHTLMVPRPPLAEATAPSPTPDKANKPGTASNITVTVLIVAVVALGLAVLLWLAFGGK